MTNDKKGAALHYAKNGLLVFPVHSVSNGVCSCYQGKDCKRKGKHPRTTLGLKSATKDINTIEKWWSIWPDSNIAVVTGKESGIVVVDVDVSEGFKTASDVLSFNDLSLPDTLVSETGGGGVHYIYKYPQEGKYKTGTEIFKNIDSRADGGYIIVPPSIHASGREYFFDNDSGEFNIDDITEAPKVFLDKIVVDDSERAVTVPSWNPDGYIPEYGIEALEACSEMADDYESWIRVGMAIHYTDPSSNGFEMWDWWSSLSKKYDSVSVESQWRNFSRRGHNYSKVVTFDSVFQYASECGWENPNVKIGSEMAELIIESSQKEIANIIKESYEPIDIAPPDTLVPNRGIMRDIYNYIMATSIRPQPELAVAASVAFLGSLLGCKYQTETGIRSNVYVVGIAESGAGKDHARKMIKKLAHQAGVMKYIGGEDFASGQAIIAAMQRYPSQLFMLDEFGRKLKASTDHKASAHMKEIITTLLVLYSSAGSVYSGKEYADQKNKPKIEIESPNACIYGTTVPSEFYEALSSSESVNGTLSRFLLFEASSSRPARQRPDLNYDTKGLAARIADIASYSHSGGDLSEFLNTETIKIDPKTVKMDDGIYDLWEELDEHCTDLMKCPISSALYSRVAENAAKLALIYAVSVNHRVPVIDLEALGWASEISLWTANVLMNRSNDRVSDNTVESNLKAVVRILKLFGPEGATKSEITKRTQFLRRQERNDILSTLVESGDVIMSSNKAGKKNVSVYVINC